jgi:RNA polymerase sigma-70 factor (ECF subfamily)
LITQGVYAPKNDVDTVRSVARGDEEAAHSLIEAHGDALLKFVFRRMGGCIEDAEEIVQDTFIAAVRMAESYDGTCSALTWLCSIARLKIRDHVAIAGRLKRSTDQPVLSLDRDTLGALKKVHDSSESIETIVDRMDRTRLIQYLLQSMSPEQQEAVVLRYVEQFSISEIAKIMARSEKAVEKLLERAKERPRKEVFKWFGDEPFRLMCFELLSL